MCAQLLLLAGHRFAPCNLINQCLSWVITVLNCKIFITFMQILKHFIIGYLFIINLLLRTLINADKFHQIKWILFLFHSLNFQLFIQIYYRKFQIFCIFNYLFVMLYLIIFRTLKIIGQIHTVASGHALNFRR